MIGITVKKASAEGKTLNLQDIAIGPCYGSWNGKTGMRYLFIRSNDGLYSVESGNFYSLDVYGDEPMFAYEPVTLDITVKEVA